MVFLHVPLSSLALWPRLLQWLELLDEQRAALDDGLPLAGDSSGSDAPEENFDDENASVQDDAEVDG